MSNILEDPSFELNSPLWVMSAGTTVRSQDTSYSGAWSVRMRRALFGVPAVYHEGSIRQDVALESGKDYPVELAVNGDLSGGTALRCYVDRGDGVEVQLGAILASPPPGWWVWTPGRFTATGEQGSIRIETSQFFNFVSGTWYVDDVSLGPSTLGERLARHRHLIIAELVNVLSGITGPGYWTDLQGRVFRRLRDPSQCIDEMPCLSVIEIGPRSQIRQDEHSLRPDVKITLIGYVRETSEDPRISTASDAASKLRDDILRCLWANQYLNNRLTAPLIVREEEIEVGLDPHFGQVYIGVLLPYHVFPDLELGPLAA